MTVLLALAMAQDFPEESGTIVVEAHQNVVHARAELDLDIRQAGYLPGIRAGDRTWYIHPQPWKPKVTVYDQGYLRVKARAVTPLMVLGGVQGVFSHPHVARAYEQRLLDELHPELTDWRQALIDYGMALRREELFEQLQELEGYPPALARARTMAMWMDTADTPEGAEVRGLIEDWAEEALGPEFLDRLSAFDK